MLSKVLLLLCIIAYAACQTCSMTQIPNALNKAGYCSSIWYSGLTSPRGVLVLSNNDVLVVEAGTAARVSVLWESSPGVVQKAVLCSVAGLNHGVAVSGGYLYASTASTVYRWPFTVGTRTPLSGTPTTVVSGMPTGGHGSRTLLFGSSANILYVSVGSNANIDPDTARSAVFSFDISLTLPRPYSSRTAVARGVRNECGIRFDSAGQMWGVENGADNLQRADLGGDIHNDNPGEEINRLGGGKYYGYPQCWSQYSLPSSVTSLPRGTQWGWPDFMSTHGDAWCRNTANNVPPSYLLPAHTAPLDIIFKGTQNFPGVAAGNAFVSQHGSWNRSPAVGYLVSHVIFSGGVPVSDEPFFRLAGTPVTGGTTTGWHRPVGLGMGKCQGVDCLLISSDATGAIIAMVPTSSCTCVGGTPTPAPTTPSCTAVAVGTGSGLTGAYYTNSAGNYFVNLVTTKVDSTVNFNWGTGGPAITSFPTDNFSIRWTGQVQPRYTGTYTFYTSSDDGSRLWVNGQLIIDSWVAQSQTEKSGTIALTAGTKYSIVLEYMELTGDAVEILSWSSSCQAKQVIPSSQLYV